MVTHVSASPQAYLNADFGGLAASGAFGLVDSSAASNMYRRQVLRQCPATFKVQALPPAKQGTWHYGCRIIPAPGCLTKNGKRFPTYEIWRRWEDCLDLQRTLEKEFEKLSLERRRRVKAQKKAGLYPSERAASFDSLPSGLDPNAIQTDLHVHLPKLTRKSTLFRASSTVIEQRGQEFEAFIAALFALETDLMEDVLDQCVVRDWFGWWRRDRASAKKAAGGDSAFLRDSEAMRSSATLSPPSTASELLAPVPQFMGKPRRPRSLVPPPVGFSIPGGYVQPPSPTSAPSGLTQFTRASVDSFRDTIDIFPSPPPSRGNHTVSPLHIITALQPPTPSSSRAVQFRDRLVTADPLAPSQLLNTRSNPRHASFPALRPSAADGSPVMVRPPPSVSLISLKSTVASLGPSLPKERKSSEKKHNSVARLSISSPIPMEMFDILEIDNIPATPRIPRPPSGTHGPMSNRANRNGRVWITSPEPISPVYSHSNSSTPVPSISRQSLGASAASPPPVARAPPSARTRNARNKRYSASSRHSLESISDVEIAYYRKESISDEVSPRSSSSSRIRFSTSSVESSYATDFSAFQSPSTRHTSLRRSLSAGEKRKSDFLANRAPVVYDEEEHEPDATDDGDDFLDEYYQLSSSRYSVGLPSDDLLQRAETAMSSRGVRNSMMDSLDTWESTGTSSRESIHSSLSSLPSLETPPPKSPSPPASGTVKRNPGFHLPIRAVTSNSSFHISPYASPSVEPEIRFEFTESPSVSPTSILTDTITLKVVYPSMDYIVSFRAPRTILLPDLCAKITSKYADMDVALKWGEGNWGLSYMSVPSAISRSASPRIGGAFALPAAHSPESPTRPPRPGDVPGGRSRSSSLASSFSMIDPSLMTMIVTRSDWETAVKAMGSSDRLTLSITEWVVPL